MLKGEFTDSGSSANANRINSKKSVTRHVIVDELQRGTRKLLGLMEINVFMILVVVSWVYMMVNTHGIVCSKCKLCLNKIDF